MRTDALIPALKSFQRIIHITTHDPFVWTDTLKAFQLPKAIPGQFVLRFFNSNPTQLSSTPWLDNAPTGIGDPTEKSIAQAIELTWTETKITQRGSVELFVFQTFGSGYTEKVVRRLKAFLHAMFQNDALARMIVIINDSDPPEQMLPFCHLIRDPGPSVDDTVAWLKEERAKLRAGEGIDMDALRPILPGYALVQLQEALTMAYILERARIREGDVSTFAEAFTKALHARPPAYGKKEG